MAREGTRVARGIVRLSGPIEEQAAFLQDLVTNDVGRAVPGAPAYAALLTPQGKYLADFLILKGEAGFALDTAPALAEPLERRLRMYLLRRPLTLERAEEQVGLVWGTDEAPEGAERDPRHPALGWRLYGARADEASADGDLLAHRLGLGIPEGGTDLVPNDTYPLEAGFEALSGVDFRKGCYVGQEVTARMKHKAELRKGYRRVRLSGAGEIGAEIRTADGRPAGTLYSNADGLGIAHLRLDRAESADTLAFEGGTVEEIRSMPEKF